jgi:deoxyribose-phosphate aldolase
VEADRALLIRCLDLTSLGDGDDADAIVRLSARAAEPVRGLDLTVAAVCVWPRFVPLARESLAGSPVRIACATGGFPVPDAPLAQRIDQIRASVDAGADEVDVVVNRRLQDEPEALAAELDATRAAAGSAIWKAILETGALTPDGMRQLADASIAAGADFLKTSTGKGAPGATPAAVAIVAERLAAAGRPVGLKISGGVRDVPDATDYLAMVRVTLGAAWPTPATFRIGASTLLEALVAEP